MTDEENRASRIAKLNDEFRRQAGLALSRRSATPGRCFMTAGVTALDEQVQAEILARVRDFSGFEPGNDPYGEHDSMKQWNSARRIPKTRPDRSVFSPLCSPRNIEMKLRAVPVETNGGVYKRATEGVERN
jgi:hypothetical protein